MGEKAEEDLVHTPDTPLVYCRGWLLKSYRVARALLFPVPYPLGHWVDLHNSMGVEEVGKVLDWAHQRVLPSTCLANSPGIWARPSRLSVLADSGESLELRRNIQTNHHVWCRILPSGTT